MSSRSDPAAVLGSVLAGRYRLEAVIGAGGMAEVFRAVDLADGRVVAVKILRGQTASNREAVARLKREGEVLGALRHKSIVAIEAAHELEDGVFLVMELLEGETLGARMRRGRLSPAELAPIVTGVVAGLAAAHAARMAARLSEYAWVAVSQSTGPVAGRAPYDGLADPQSRNAGVLAPTPRGSHATMSNCSTTDLGNRCHGRIGSLPRSTSRKERPDLPGPPGLKVSVPSFFFAVARWMA
jgi:serine/threonine protein kinase